MCGVHPNWLAWVAFRITFPYKMPLMSLDGTVAWIGGSAGFEL